MAESNQAHPVRPVRIDDTPPKWPLLAVAGWILSRDPAVVAELCADEATAAKKASILRLNGRWDAVERALDELRNTLYGGYVPARGDRGDGLGMRQIPEDEWRHLRIFCEDGPDRAGPWSGVVIARDTALGLWPAEEIPTDRDPDPHISVLETMQWLIDGAKVADDVEPALEEMRCKIGAEKLKAYGRKQGYGEWQEIPAIDTADTELEPLFGELQERNLHHTRWRGIHFKRKDVLRLWPAAKSVEAKREARQTSRGSIATDAGAAVSAQLPYTLSLAQAVNWLVFRWSYNGPPDVLEALQLHRGRYLDEDMPNLHMTAEKAREALDKAIRAGLLTIRGRRVHLMCPPQGATVDSEASDIPPEDWADLWLAWDEEAAFLRRTSVPQVPRWQDLRVRRDEILTLWPLEGKSPLVAALLAEPAAPSRAVDPYSNGAGGHRTAIHFVQQEHQRRTKAGDACEKLKDEAEYLAAWVRREHPKAPPLSPGRIENVIRQPHNEWKSASTAHPEPTLESKCGSSVDVECGSSLQDCPPSNATTRVGPREDAASNPSAKPGRSV